MIKHSICYDIRSVKLQSYANELFDGGGQYILKKVIFNQNLSNVETFCGKFEG